MEKANIKKYFLQLSKSKSFLFITILFAIFKMLPSWFCLLYSTIIGKFIILIGALFLSYNNITAGFFSFVLLIFIHERCDNLIIENFDIQAISNANDSNQKTEINMKPIQSPDDFRKRICVASYKDFIIYDASGNPQNKDKSIFYTINPNIANNKEFFNSVIMPFYIGKTLDTKTNKFTGNFNGKIVDNKSFSKENGCDTDNNVDTFSFVNNICNPKCNWKTIDNPNK